MLRTLSMVVVGTLLWAALGSPAPAAVPADQIEKMKAAAPDKAPATPKKARKLLIYTATKGFRHSSIPLAAEAIKYLGEKTKAYETVITDDASMFKPETLKQFDAVCFDQCTGSRLPSLS
jgi:uncharacterized protein